MHPRACNATSRQNPCAACPMRTTRTGAKAMLIEALTLAAATQFGAAVTELMREPLYDQQMRAVSNWRLQAIRALELDLSGSFAFATGGEPDRLPRCVRLNNYWCIKSARWKG